MERLLREISKCTVCAAFLPNPPRPVVAASVQSRIMVVGQAPGRKVHAAGIAWHDQSGDNLRRWLGVESKTFYDTALFALIPTGFCYPGTGKSGDLPPRPECAPLWHPRLREKMPAIQLMLLIGQYSQRFYLGEGARENLTETVRHFRDYLPQFLPLPHPSPRNRMWVRRNPWFEAELLPELKTHIAEIIEH